MITFYRSSGCGKNDLHSRPSERMVILSKRWAEEDLCCIHQYWPNLKHFPLWPPVWTGEGEPLKISEISRFFSAFQEFFALMSIQFISRFTFYNVRHTCVLRDEPPLQTGQIEFCHFDVLCSSYPSCVLRFSGYSGFSINPTFCQRLRYNPSWASNKSLVILSIFSWTGTWWYNLFRRWPIRQSRYPWNVTPDSVSTQAEKCSLYRVSFLTGPAQKVLSVRLHSISHQKVLSVVIYLPADT